MEIVEIKEHKENPFPDDLEGRLNAVLNCVNTELKTVTLLHLDDAPADRADIKKRVRETVGQGYLPQVLSFGEYCRQSLFPIGMVAEELVLYRGDKEPVACYKLTEGGKKYGLPIATFTLDYAVRNNLSMFSILGSTASSGKSRSPLNIIKILEELKQGKTRLTDLYSSSKLDPANLVMHMRNLEKIHFVRYESAKEHSIKKYQWIGGDLTKLKPYSGRPKLTERIIKKIAELKEFDTKTISVMQNANMGNISAILNEIEKQGFIKSERWNGEKRSEIELFNFGRQFLEDYIDKIKDCLNDGESFSELSDFYKQLVNSEERFRDYTRQAIDLYTLVSPGINKKPIEETQEQIITYLRRNPGKRPSEMMNHFSLRGQGKYLSPLLSSGILRKEREKKEDKRVVRYYVND